MTKEQEKLLTGMAADMRDLKSTQKEHNAQTAGVAAKLEGHLTDHKKDKWNLYGPWVMAVCIPFITMLVTK